MKQRRKQQIRKLFACGKPLYKKWWAWLLGILLLIILIAVPFIINWSYMKGLTLKEPNTMFEASDLLSFYGALLTLIGTVILSLVTIIQNNRANKMSTILMEEQKQMQLPFLWAKDNECYFECTPNTDFSMEPDKETDVCFAMQLGHSRKKQFGYIGFTLKNVSDFSVNGIKPLWCSVQKLGSKLPEKLYPMFERTLVLEKQETKSVLIKLIDDNMKLQNQHVNYMQITIHFECYNAQRRRCEFYISILVNKDLRKCEILGDTLRVKYREEKNNDKA